MTNEPSDCRGQDEVRRSRRLGLAMPARCRMLSGFTEDVMIRDISEGGCRVASAVLRLRAGDRVLLRPPGMEGLSGIVRWFGRGEAGIEFERPLYVAVVEHLHRQFVTFLPSEIAFRSGQRSLAA